MDGFVASAILSTRTDWLLCTVHCNASVRLEFRKRLYSSQSCQDISFHACETSPRPALSLVETWPRMQNSKSRGSDSSITVSKMRPAADILSSNVYLRQCHSLDCMKELISGILKRTAERSNVSHACRTREYSLELQHNSREVLFQLFDTVYRWFCLLVHLLVLWCF